MNDNSIVILKEWYLAHEDAKQNAALMCSQKSSVEESRRITNECAARMDRCFAADEKLFKVEDIPLVTLFKNQGQGSELLIKNLRKSSFCYGNNLTNTLY